MTTEYLESYENDPRTECLESYENDPDRTFLAVPSHELVPEPTTATENKMLRQRASLQDPPKRALFGVAAFGGGA